MTDQASIPGAFPDHRDAAEEPTTRLADLVHGLGSHALWTTTPEAFLDRPVGEPVMLGLGEPIAVRPSGLLLVIGASDTAATAVAIRRAAEAGYVGVVLKPLEHDVQALSDVAVEADMALLLTPDEMAWRHLDALLEASRFSVTSSTPHDYLAIGLGDLFSLANAIAAAVGGAVTIESPRGRVMAYSNLPGHDVDEVRRQSILGRQVPEYPSTRDTYASALGQVEPMLVEPPSDDVALRWAVSVRNGDRVLGLVWVLADRPSLTGDPAAILADAARVCALHMLHAKAQRDPEQYRRAEALRSLLTGSSTPTAIASRLQLSSTDGAVVLAIAQAAGDDGRHLTTQTLDLVMLHCQFWHPRALSVVEGDVVYAFLPLDGRARAAVAARQLAVDLVSASRRGSTDELRVAVGSVAETLAAVPQSRLTADRVLEVLQERQPSPDGDRAVASLDDVRSQVLLAQLAASGALDGGVLDPSVSAIVSHDRDNDTEYAATLIAYFAALGDVTTAARQLQVHDNTLRYRLRRLTDVFSLDLQDGDLVLSVWLQLRLLQNGLNSPPTDP